MKHARWQLYRDVRGTERVTDKDPEARYESLEKYTRDLTAMAEAGKLDPVIGRDEEVRRVMQVLQRRTKNNPVLIEPGVGKTAIVEGTFLSESQQAMSPKACAGDDCSVSTWAL